MRMWLCDPKILCRKHLLGEHVEMHMFVGTLLKKKSIIGYLYNNLFEPAMLSTRHKQLVEEMKNRGMNHQSEISFDDAFLAYENIQPWYRTWTVERDSALKDLLSRCPSCLERCVKLKLEQGYVYEGI